MAFTVTRSDYSSGSRVETVEFFGVATTLSAKSETVQVMSDIWEKQLYVMYWDTAAGKPAGRFLADDAKVTIDYTPEVLKAYVAYMAKLNYGAALEKLVNRVSNENHAVVAGKKVKITGGRPKPGVSVGAEYTVFHVMERSYGQGYQSSVRPIAGIALNEEKHDVVGKNGKTYQSYKNVAWVWCHNMEVVGADDATAKAMPMLVAQAKESMAQYVTSLISTFTQPHKKVA